MFALEASRLSRSQADWHRLLDLCAWTQTLLVDHDGVYDPNDFNDRVLLGFKGTWSATELHAMRMRLHGGRRHAAAKGTFRLHPPAGYVYEGDGTLILDPDEGVVDAIRRVFRDFRSLGSAYAVARDHVERGLLLPDRAWRGAGQLGTLTWGSARTVRVTSILRNPTYAGAYVYGRRPSRPILRDGVLVGTRQVSLPAEEWGVVIRDAHVGYITWQDYEDNGRLLTMNRTSVETGERRGRPRRGAALLQGLVLCGRCGRRMQVSYRGDGGKIAAYTCPQREGARLAEERAACWLIGAQHVDPIVERHVLEQVSHDNLDMSLQVLRHLEQEVAATDHTWQLRLERARHEASRAERQFHLAEPENRLVVRSLERRWEEKLAELDELERAYETEKQRPQLVITPAQRAQILALARDLPAVWSAPTTKPEDRKELLGLLVKQVVLIPEDLPKSLTRVRILWHQGATTEVIAPRPRRMEAVRTPPHVLAQIRELVAEHTDKEIAQILEERGVRTGRGRRFTAMAVVSARHNHGVMRKNKDKRAAGRIAPRDDGRYSSVGLAHLAGVHISTVHYWRKKGRIQGVQDLERGAWWFEVTPELLDTLKASYPHKRHGKQGGVE